MEYIAPPKMADIQQRQLSKTCFWEAYDQLLWVDARKILPELQVFKLPGWEWMLMDGAPIPEYPDFLKPLNWTRTAEFDQWLKQIPKWVADSCRLFPSHQMRLLHYVGKSPPLLELLDHAPYLAWRLVASKLQEPEIVALLSGKRQTMVEQLGWPGLKQTLKFLQNLRLRQVNSMIAEQVETCVLDPERLTALTALPRINSMALTLAARFPEMIGCPLHHSLAKQPCQPMQCQSMIALLEDGFLLVKNLNLPAGEIAKIGQCLYLTQVHELYLKWLQKSLKALNFSKNSLIEAFLELPFSDDLPAGQNPHFLLDWSQIAQNQLPQVITLWQLTAKPQKLENLQVLMLLSCLQEHAWYFDNTPGDEHSEIFVWTDSEGESIQLWAAQVRLDSQAQRQIKIRGLENTLPSAKAIAHFNMFMTPKLSK